MTRAEHYNAYYEATQAIIDAREKLKTLRAQGEQAATIARDTTVGTLQEKRAAIRAAWVPFLRCIAEVEQSTLDNRESADRHFDAWRGLNQ
jgi:hypothetical protein